MIAYLMSSTTRFVGVSYVDFANPSDMYIGRLSVLLLLQLFACIYHFSPLLEPSVHIVSGMDVSSSLGHFVENVEQKLS